MSKTPKFLLSSFLAVVAIFACSVVVAQIPAGIPELSSRPGADYTLYINVGGFNYDGFWRGDPVSPGYTPPLNDIPNTGTFSAAEQEQIRNIWAQQASAYVGFNVNVTTIDPYDTVGDPTPTDAERQAFYDMTPNMMHMVIGSQLRANGMGGQAAWFGNGSADGVSGRGVIAGIAGIPGDHTNFMFSEAQAGAATGGIINGGYIGAVSAHEHAHAFGLDHQSDYDGAALVNVYSLGDAADGPGTYVPIIGQADGRQRVGWRLGDSNLDDEQTFVNDVGLMLSTSSVAGSGRPGAVDMAYIDDGIGGTMGTATPLPLAGGMILVSSSNSKGVIVPLDNDPDPLGSENYTSNWHSFSLDASSTINLTVHNGTDFLVPGVSDLAGVDFQAGTLRSALFIVDATGSMVGMGTEDASTLFTTYSGMLPGGSYFAVVESQGGHMQNQPLFNDAFYFDMGAYFVTGSGFGSFLLGDVNTDGVVDLLDVSPFVDVLTMGGFQLEADINQDQVVNLLDVAPFVNLLTGG